jgi:hypothetical protein
MTEISHKLRDWYYSPRVDIMIDNVQDKSASNCSILLRGQKYFKEKFVYKLSVWWALWTVDSYVIPDSRNVFKINIDLDDLYFFEVQIGASKVPFNIQHIPPLPDNIPYCKSTINRDFKDIVTTLYHCLETSKESIMINNVDD